MVLELTNVHYFMNSAVVAIKLVQPQEVFLQNVKRSSMCGFMWATVRDAFCKFCPQGNLLLLMQLIII